MSVREWIASLTQSNADQASEPLPTWKVVGYTCAIVAMLYLGTYLGAILNVTSFRETVETLPVFVCLIFVLRLPKRAPHEMNKVWRVLFLLAPLLLLSFADLEFPAAIFDDVALLAIVAIESIAIGVSEELTFRYALHRLWSQYSATFYVVASSLIFGLLHTPEGAEVAIIAAILGTMFALARIAGAPIIVLIAIHGFVDAPGRAAAAGITF